MKRVKICFVFLLVLFSFVHRVKTKAPREKPLSTNNGPQVVMSLGSDCEVAHQLRRKKLIITYLPFDWLKSSDFEKVFELLNNNFSDFLNDKNLEEKGTNEIDNPPRRAVLDVRYNLLFVHDFDIDKAVVANEEVKEKYERRIKRFKEIMLSKATIYFFRKDITQDQALKLSQLFSHKWPHVKHTIVALGGSEEMKQSWQNLSHVRNFYLEEIVWPPAHGWKENDERWDEIFEELKLVPRVKS